MSFVIFRFVGLAKAMFTEFNKTYTCQYFSPNWIKHYLYWSRSRLFSANILAKNIYPPSSNPPTDKIYHAAISANAVIRLESWEIPFGLRAAPDYCKKSYTSNALYNKHSFLYKYTYLETPTTRERHHNHKQYTRNLHARVSSRIEKKFVKSFPPSLSIPLTNSRRNSLKYFQ